MTVTAAVRNRAVAAVGLDSVTAVPPREDSTDIGRIERELTTFVRRTRALARRGAAEIHPDLAPAAYLILVRLVDEGPRRASDLVEIFGIDKAAISRHVRQLEGLGLIERAPDPLDGRAQTLSATTYGRTRCQAARRRTREALRHQLQTWPSKDIRILGELLGRLNKIDIDT